MYQLRNDHGFMLPAAMLLVVVLFLLGWGVLYLGRVEETEAIKEEHLSQAFALAEAGVQRALWKLWDDPLGAGGWSNEALGNGTYTVVIEEALELGDAWVRIRSTGTVQSASRTVTQDVQVRIGWPAAFDYTLFWSNPPDKYAPLLTFANGVAIVGDIFAYGDLHFTPGASVPEGWFVYSTGTVTGSGFTLGELPASLPPRVTLDLTPYRDLINDANTAPAGDWVVEKDETRQLNGETIFVNGKADIKQQAIIQGPGAIVATEEINIGMQAQITGGVDLISGIETIIKNRASFSGSGEGNVVYSEGKIEIDNDASLQDAIIVTEDMVTLSNNVDVRGIVYAGTAKLGNSTRVVGRLYADTFESDELENAAQVEDDEAVLDYPVPPGFPKGTRITLGKWAEE